MTSGQHHLTPQHPPRDASPAGLVENEQEMVVVFFYILVLCDDHFLGWLMRLCLYFFSRLLSIAEETLTEFLSKATGTAVEWVQMPGMKVSSLFLVIQSC